MQTRGLLLGELYSNWHHNGESKHTGHFPRPTLGSVLYTFSFQFPDILWSSCFLQLTNENNVKTQPTAVWTGGCRGPQEAANRVPSSTVITTASLIKASYFTHPSNSYHKIGCYLNFIKCQDKGEGNLQVLLFVMSQGLTTQPGWPGTQYIEQATWNSQALPAKCWD